MRLTVVGTGYAGLVTGVCLTQAGHHVSCVDVIPDRVAAINRGIVPFYEPGLPELLSKALGENQFSATCDLTASVTESDITIIAVGTPFRDGAIDLTYVKKAAEQVGRALPSRYHVVVVKSTVVPGTTDTMVRQILERASGRKAGEFGLCMNPEFLREGSAVPDFMEPDRIVIGQWDDRSGHLLSEVYQPYHCPQVFTTLRSAEMIKYASNALLATLVSFSNEIGELCERSPDLDVEQVMDGLHLDRRLSPLVAGARVQPGILSYLRAGCGFGGSCLPKDVSALSAYAVKQGVTPHLLNAVMAVNNQRLSKLVTFTEGALGKLEGATIAVLGLAFKPGTDDLRNSPALSVIEGLLKKRATVRVYDTVAAQAGRALLDNDVRFCSTPEQVLEGADAAVAVTAWSELADWNWPALCAKMRRQVIIDGRNTMRGVRWPKDVTYIPIGRQPRNRPITSEVSV